jgi:hypothetical protein
MVRKIDGEAPGSWLERARAEGSVSPGARAESESAAGARSGDSSIGWDPYDVWLCHVDMPRRRRDTLRR